MTEEINNVDVAEAIDLLDRGAFLLDVREEDEWLAGHAPGATHVRLSDLPDRVGDVPKDHTIVCACRSGGRSARAAAFLTEQGFHAVNLAGGMQQWAAEENPLVADGAAATII